MSTTRIGGSVVFDCDDCGEDLDTGETEFHDAVAEKKRAGWGSRKEPDGSWSDICEACGTAK